MKALTLGVLEIVAWVDHGELDLGSVGEVDRLIDQQPARLHAALEGERHAARLPLSKFTFATTVCIRSASAAGAPDASMRSAVPPVGRGACAPLTWFRSRIRPRRCGWGTRRLPARPWPNPRHRPHSHLGVQRHRRRPPIIFAMLFIGRKSRRRWSGRAMNSQRS